MGIPRVKHRITHYGGRVRFRFEIGETTDYEGLDASSYSGDTLHERQLCAHVSTRCVEPFLDRVRRLTSEITTMRSLELDRNPIRVA